MLVRMRPTRPSYRRMRDGFMPRLRQAGAALRAYRVEGLGGEAGKPGISSLGGHAEGGAAGCGGRAEFAEGPGGPLGHREVGRRETAGQHVHRRCRSLPRSSEKRDRPVRHEGLVALGEFHQRPDRLGGRGAEFLQGRRGPLAGLIVGVAAGPHERHGRRDRGGAGAAQPLGGLRPLAGVSGPELPDEGLDVVRRLVGHGSFLAVTSGSS